MFFLYVKFHLIGLSKFLVYLLPLLNYVPNVNLNKSMCGYCEFSIIRNVSLLSFLHRYVNKYYCCVVKLYHVLLQESLVASPARFEFLEILEYLLIIMFGIKVIIQYA